MSSDRFDARFAGSNYGPLTVAITSGGQAYDLTGDTAVLTMTPARGGSAVVAALANTNTPGTGGTFEFQLTTAQVATPGEYVCVVTCTIDGDDLVLVYRHRIDPLTD